MGGGSHQLARHGLAPTAPPPRETSVCPSHGWRPYTRRGCDAWPEKCLRIFLHLPWSTLAQASRHAGLCPRHKTRSFSGRQRGAWDALQERALLGRAVGQQHQAEGHAAFGVTEAPEPAWPYRGPQDRPPALPATAALSAWAEGAATTLPSPGSELPGCKARLHELSTTHL